MGNGAGQHRDEERQPGTGGVGHWTESRIESRTRVYGCSRTVLGTAASRRLSTHKGQLNMLFAAGIVLVAITMLYRSWTALSA